MGENRTRAVWASRRQTRTGRGAWCLLLSLALTACAPDPVRPHLVLITADTLRPDHLSQNGYPRATSPRLDAFAEGAWSFDDAVTPIPKTGPAFTTLFTGRHPEEHGVRWNFTTLPTELPLLAERLSAAGYRTAAFVGNPVLRESKGYGRGFDHYETFSKDDGVAPVNAAFFEWAAAEWDQPSFVWIHYIDPHGPYEPPAEFEALFLDDEWASSDERVSLDYVVPEGGNKNKVLGAVPDYQQRADGEDRVAKYVARYDAEIRFMDTAFGEVVDYLRERELFDPSVIVFTSDHGESLGEHDFYFEHGWFAFEPTLRVPLMVKAPGQNRGARRGDPASHLDFVPTVAELLNLEPGLHQGGRDLLSDAAAPVSERLVIQNSDAYPEKFYGVREGGWKYLVRQRDGHEELYHLVDDPGELESVASEYPQRLKSMRSVLLRRLSALRARAAEPSEPGAEDDPLTLQQLEALGYTGEEADEH